MADRNKKAVSAFEEQFECAADFGFVGLNATAELDLDACAMQILPIIFRLEIDISREIVREETEGQFIGDEAGRIVDMLFVEICERAFAVLLVAVEQSEAEIDVEIDFRKVCAFLSGGIAARTETITDVIEDEAWLDGIEIDDGGAFGSCIVDHDVGGLGVAVNRAELHFATGFGVF